MKIMGLLSKLFWKSLNNCISYVTNEKCGAYLGIRKSIY